MWNKSKSTKKLELYFGDVNSISGALRRQAALKIIKFEDNDHFMVTVNECKGLIAFYDTFKGSVSFNLILNNYK